jgi:hypothetical protein
MTTPSTASEIQAALDAGKQLTSIAGRTGSIEDIPVVLIPEGMKLEVRTDILDERIRRKAAPTRRKGTAQHQELSSFLQHVIRFKDEDSVVWADIDKLTLTALHRRRR